MNHDPFAPPPGPYWSDFDPSTDVFPAQGKIQREIPEGLVDVARMWFAETLTDGASYKTLQLFAAAPELLEACKAQYKLLHECLRHSLGNGPLVDPSDFTGVIAQTASAMLKAEGRTQ